MWERIKTFFKDSETIFWARFQAFVGILAILLTAVDPSVLAPIFPVGWFPWFLLANGIATEILRRRREPDM